MIQIGVNVSRYVTTMGVNWALKPPKQTVISGLVPRMRRNRDRCCARRKQSGRTDRIYNHTLPTRVFYDLQSKRLSEHF